jgi:hypothetical protein
MDPLTYQFARLKINGEIQRTERERMFRRPDRQSRLVTFGPRWLRARLGRLFAPQQRRPTFELPRPAGV